MDVEQAVDMNSGLWRVGERYSVCNEQWASYISKIVTEKLQQLMQCCGMMKSWVEIPVRIYMIC